MRARLIGHIAPGDLRPDANDKMPPHEVDWCLVGASVTKPAPGAFRRILGTIGQAIIDGFAKHGECQLVVLPRDPPVP